MEIFSSYTGTDFLIFYVVMLATAALASIWIPAFVREEGRRAQLNDIEEVAFLSGGTNQYVAAILTRLFASGALEQASKYELQVARTADAVGDAERLVLNKVGSFKLREAKKTLEGDAVRVENQLVRKGLLIEGDDRMKLRWISTVPFIVLIVIGIYREQAGSALGEPTGLLQALLFLTVIALILRLWVLNPRTRAGNDELERLKSSASRIRRAPDSNEAGYAVAIFGTGVLVGTPWEPVHAMRQSQSGDGGSGGGDGDGGGSGCGGGCGGCGG